jgi:hypothetical protein
MTIQTKLEVGRADDPLEREADRVADAIMRSLGAADPSVATRIQRAERGPDRLGGRPVDRDVERGVASRRGHGAPLHTRIARRVGDVVGHDLTSVRVHADGPADRLAQSLDARAFTVGRDIFVRSGERTSIGSEPTPLLAHELAHVVQQGAVSRTVRRVTAPADQGKADKAEAKAYGEQFLDFYQLRAWVNEGAAVTGTGDADRRLRNSCQWILDGRAKLYAVTRTGDSDERVTQAGQNRREQAAYFPRALAGSAGDVMSLPTHYHKDDLDDNANVRITRVLENGWNLPALVAIVRPRKLGKKEVFTVLRHEVQHDADESWDKKAAANAGGLAGKHALERYKTEYRAYSYEASKNDKKSATKVVSRRGYNWTEKQYHIFSHIYEGYDHTKNGWDNDIAVGGGQTFRAAVVAYVDPDVEGFNKFNSGAVRDLYTALKACADAERDYMADTAFAVQEVVRKISKEDAVYVLDGSPELTALIERKLTDLAYTLPMDQLRRKAGRK